MSLFVIKLLNLLIPYSAFLLLVDRSLLLLCHCEFSSNYHSHWQHFTVIDLKDSFSILVLYCPLVRNVPLAFGHC